MSPTILKKFLLPAGAFSGTRAWTGPLDVSVDVTGRCNLDCIGCTDHSPLLENSAPATDDQPADIPFSIFTRLCDGLSEFHGSTVVLSGEGEPLLHPHLVKMVRYAKSRKLKLRLSTNGTLLVREKAKELIEVGLDELVLSLWATDSDFAGHVYPARGAATLATQLQNLESLQQEKRALKSLTPSVILYHPLNRHSIASPERLLEMAGRTGCDFVHFSLLRTRQGRVSDLAPSRDQINNLENFSRSSRKDIVRSNLKDVLLSYQLGEKVWEKTPCYVGWFGFYLNRSGEFQPCKMCKLPLGKIDQIPLKGWWNGPTMRNFRDKTAHRKELTDLLNSCDCDYCCYAVANFRLNRRIVWLRKFLPSQKA